MDTPADATSTDGAGNLRSGRIVVGEASRRPRQVGVQREPRPRTVVVGPLHAEPAARPSGFRRARVADEDELRIEGQAPDGDRRLQLRDEDRAHAEFTAACAHERRHPVRRVARRRIDGDRRAASIVAVVAVSEVAIQLEPASTGANTTPSLGLRRPADSVPAFSRRLLRTSK